MDQERKEYLLKSYSLGRKRYILVHGVFNWGLSTALIYRAILTIATYGWSLEEIARGIFSVETLYAMVVFGLVGVLFGHFMWKWIEKTVKSFSSEPTKGKGPKDQRGKKRRK